MAQWKLQNPDATIEELEKIDTKYCNEHNYRTVEFWIKKNPGITIKEAETLRREFLKNSNIKPSGFVLRNNNKLCIDYWTETYPDKTAEECEVLRKTYMKEHNLAGRSGMTNGNSRMTASEFDRKSRSPYCVEFYIRKYPNKTIEECEQLRKEFHDKLKTYRKRENNKACIEYWRSHYPDKTEEEVDKMYREYQGSRCSTLEQYKEKYGDELGVEKFNERQKIWKAKLNLNMLLNGDGRSPQSKYAVHCISEVCKHLGIEYPKKEKYISNGINNFAYDFCYENKIIEFNGDYWHCNPDLFDEDFYNTRKRMTAKQIWESDKYKKSVAEQYGYKVLYIWELEYNECPEAAIKKCIDFIDD